MNYLSILQELFESDTVLFLLIGIISSVAIGLKMKTTRQRVLLAVLAFLMYAVCEVIENIPTNFAVELAILFVGTIMLGGFFGGLAILAVNRIKSMQDR